MTTIRQHEFFAGRDICFHCKRKLQEIVENQIPCIERDDLSQGPGTISQGQIPVPVPTPPSPSSHREGLGEALHRANEALKRNNR